MCRKLTCLAFILMAAAQISYGALVAQWKFNNDLTDSVGTLTWTANGGAAFSTDAKEGSHSIGFDGVDDYLSVTPTGPLAALFSTKTVCLWFKASTTSGTHVLFDEGGSTNGFAIRVNNGRLEAAAQDNHVTVSVGVNFTSTEWTHVTVTFDNGQVSLYVNGAPPVTASGAITSIRSHTNSAGIGARSGQDAFDNSSTGHYFGGLIDDVRIYDNVLSFAEVGQLAGGLWPYAYNPSPADGAILMQNWATLTWSAGLRSVSHDVYMGETFDDVNSDTGGTFRGNQTDATFIAGLPGFAYPAGLVPGTTYYWRIDEVNNASAQSPWKGAIWSFTVPSQKAYNPSPANGQKFIDPAATLSWTAGFNAKVRSVYFGDKFDDVNNAAGAALQTDTTYTPAGPLERGKTYYWRVDEFDGATTYKGDVWSFTTIPAVAIADPNLVVLWTLDEGMGRTVVDWSGHDHHGTVFGATQWVEGYQGTALHFADNVYVESAYTGLTGTAARTCCAWIRIPIPANRTIMSWGLNVATQKWRIRLDTTGGLRAENNGGNIYGVTNVGDGRWHHVAVVFANDGSPDIGDVLLYVDGRPDMVAAVTPNALDTAVGPLRIGEDPWHNAPWLDEIDEARVYNKALTQQEIALVMRVDPLLAWAPTPAEDTTPDIEHATPLIWTRGDKAGQHDVYFGLDKAAVANANASDTTGIYRGRQSAASFTPAEGVTWGGGPYFWRVDENNNDGTITKGRTWSFKVANYLVVDDIESYNDLAETDPASNRIYKSWIDGFGTTTNGALVGNLNVPLTEHANVHGGAQAMPLSYDNNLKFSEATLTLKAGNDWTRKGVANLSLWYRGAATNAAEKMYVALNGTAVVYNNDTTLTQKTTWTEWVIPLQQFSALGVNLSNVTSITIGLGTRGSTALAGGTGQMYFDDIRLY